MSVGPVRPRRLPPPAVLLLGLLAASACLLLLFGPFYPPYGSPGERVRISLLRLLGGSGLPSVSRLLEDRFVPLVVAALVVVLALLPWRAARDVRPLGAADAAGREESASGEAPSVRTRATRTVHSSSLSFADDGRILDGELRPAPAIHRSVPELRRLARATGIPWRADFETEGGARGFLEIVRALHGDPVDARRAAADGSAVVDGDGDGDVDVDVAAAAATAVGAGAGAGARAAGGAAGAGAGAGADSHVEQTDLRAEESSGDAAGDLSSGYRDTAAPWSPGSSAAVYTPTTLYRSDRIGPRDDPDEDEEHGR